jgi:hypothetical protein
MSRPYGVESGGLFDAEQVDRNATWSGAVEAGPSAEALHSGTEAVVVVEPSLLFV